MLQRILLSSVRRRSSLRTHMIRPRIVPHHDVWLGSEPTSSSILSNHQHYQQQHQQRRQYMRPKYIIDEESINDDHPLSPYIQSCVSGVPSTVEDSEFGVFFLGTGGHMPSRHRNTSATVLRVGGTSLLFDAGEGVQRQLMKTRIRLQSISQIFITHLHGDHLYGLPGLLLHLQSVSYGRQQQQPKRKDDDNNHHHVVELYGPPGLYNYVALTLTLSSVASTVGSIVVYELTGGMADPGYVPDGTQQPRDARHAPYREAWRRNLTKKTIPRNDDGIWTISHDTNNNGERRSSSSPSIMAAEVRHVQGVQTFGFAVQEPSPQPNIDVNKAKAAGVQPGRKYKQLKAGHAVESDDGTRQIQPEDVMIEGATTKRARKFAIVGDNCELSTAMYRLCQGAHVLVHEATLLDNTIGSSIQKTERDRWERGHATPEMAGQVAQAVDAQVLVLNHLSPKVAGDDYLDEITQRASSSNGSSAVIVAHDFMELVVPFAGFDHGDETTTTTTAATSSSGSDPE